MRNLPNDTLETSEDEAFDMIPAPRRGGHVAERRCILSGIRGDPEGMIRLAFGPDRRIVPDVRAKAQGRGAWLGVSRAELEQALANGKLKGALARGFKTGDIILPDDLPERIDLALRDALLDRLGLEAKASMLLTGSAKIEEAARRGQVELLLHAADARPDGSGKLDQALRVGQEVEGSGLSGTILPVGRDILSKAMGRENVVHIAITDQRAAARLKAALGRWQSYLGCANGAPSRAAPSEMDGVADAAGVPVDEN